MNIVPNKSLIREIAPGVIQIGNNPFAPSLSLNELTKKAQVSGNDVLTDGALDNISGLSLDYDSATIDNAIFFNVRRLYCTIVFSNCNSSICKWWCRN